jgi:hypothetical protein
MSAKDKNIIKKTHKDYVQIRQVLHNAWAKNNPLSSYEIMMRENKNIKQSQSINSSESGSMNGNKISIKVGNTTVRIKDNVKYLPQIQSSFYVGAQSILNKYTGSDSDKTHFMNLNGRGRFWDGVKCDDAKFCVNVGWS